MVDLVTQLEKLLSERPPVREDDPWWDLVTGVPVDEEDAKALERREELAFEVATMFIDPQPDRDDYLWSLVAELLQSVDQYDPHVVNPVLEGIVRDELKRR